MTTLTATLACSLFLTSADASRLATPPVAPAGATATTEASSKASPIAIARLAPLAGTWQGFVGDSFVEEIWSTPQGDTIMGCFRWCDAKRNPTMLEMLLIRKEADAVRLRLRHYSPTLVGKEEKDAPITMRLASAEGSVFLFEAEKHAGDLASVRYAVDGDALDIEVAFAAPAEGKSQRPPLRFQLKRAAP
jgi:hypothetical protein